MKRYCILILLVCLFSACSLWKNHKASEPQDEVLARVGDAELHRSDLGSLGKGLPAKDSVELVKAFAKNWVQKKLFLAKAQENLSDQLNDLDRRMEDYRESLIIYSYENELIKQKLDTSVNREEMSKYYNEHQAEFQLKNEVYRMKFIQLRKGDSHIHEMGSLLRSDKFEDATLLNSMCRQYAVNSSISDSAYFNSDFLLRNFPLSNYDIRVIAGGLKYKEVSDDEFTYLIFIRQTILTGNTAPLDMVKDDIRRILQNHKKLDFIDGIYKQLYEEGAQNKQFEILIGS